MAKAKVVKKVAKKKAAKIQAPLIKVPKFKKASEACAWIGDTLNKSNWIQGALAGRQLEMDDMWEYGFDHLDDGQRTEAEKEFAMLQKKGELYSENILPDDGLACGFCSVGWIQKADQGLEREAYAGLIYAIKGKRNVESHYKDLSPYKDETPNAIIEWNDNKKRKVAEVKAAFKKATKLLATWEKAGKPGLDD